MRVPELSHVEQRGRQICFSTTEGVLGVAYRLPIIDLEQDDAGAKLQSLQSLVQSSKPGFCYRVINRSFQRTELWFESDRHKAIEQSGFLDQEIVISIEYSAPGAVWNALSFWKKQGRDFDSFIDQVPHHLLQELGAIPLDETQTRGLFFLPSAPLERLAQSLDAGSEVIGVARLWKQGKSPLSEETLANLRDSLPLPFELDVTFRKVGSAKNEFRLRSQLARQSLSQDPTSQRRAEAVVRHIEASALDGAGIVEIEWLLILRRSSEELLRSELAEAASILRGLGDVMIETVGVVPSFQASLVGTSQHFTFQEVDTESVVYLPVFSFGANAQSEIPTSRSLVLHRLDGSLHLFDQFSPRFLAYNLIISGKTGSGKSVLANALSNALLQDENIQLITIDVGGSYKKECELYEGEEVTFSLSEPSGINPFGILAGGESSNEAIEVLAKFTCVLLREEGETAVSRALQTRIDTEIKGYAQSNPSSASIDDFCNWSSDFPRKDLLKRWCQGGVFENALRPRGNHSRTGAKRYRYYNFETIQNAASPEYSEGVMAAVIAQVNLEMIRLGPSDQQGKRLVLRVDESRFFIERNADFFLLTTANFRKFGHGTILNVQRIQNFELSQANGKSDSGIILNSPIRFFLEQDVERDYLKNTFQLAENHLAALVDSPYRGKQYRQMVLQDDTGTRLVRLHLTDEEYWRMTSSKEDNNKIQNLLKAVPGLKMKEAIACLASV